jgi:hypothetical protein
MCGKMTKHENGAKATMFNSWPVQTPAFIQSDTVELGVGLLSSNADPQDPAIDVGTVNQLIIYIYVYIYTVYYIFYIIYILYNIYILLYIYIYIYYYIYYIYNNNNIYIYITYYIYIIIYIWAWYGTGRPSRLAVNNVRLKTVRWPFSAKSIVPMAWTSQPSSPLWRENEPCFGHGTGD